MTFADIILPLALPKRSYTYAVPGDLAPDVRPGVRVEVPFGKNKLYSGVVDRVHTETPGYRVKPILAVLDEVAVVRTPTETLGLDRRLLLLHPRRGDGRRPARPPQTHQRNPLSV